MLQVQSNIYNTLFIQRMKKCKSFTWLEIYIYMYIYKTLYKYIFIFRDYMHV